MKTEININGEKVPILGDESEAISDSVLFKEWLSRIDPSFKIRSIEIQSVDMSHKDASVPFFIKLKADVVYPNGNKFETVVFIRGGAVAIVCFLLCEGETYVATTLQPRFPVGHIISEIPAGMIDNGEFARDAAIRELEEESFLVSSLGITPEDIIDLHNEVYGENFPGIFLSPGGTSEYVRIFAIEKDISREMLDKLQGSHTGLAEEDEDITLQILKHDDAIRTCPDAKILAAFTLYEFYKKKK